MHFTIGGASTRDFIDPIRPRWAVPGGFCFGGLLLGHRAHLFASPVTRAAIAPNLGDPDVSYGSQSLEPASRKVRSTRRTSRSGTEPDMDKAIRTSALRRAVARKP
jgi:hypothetical protein